ncbi:MAG TPA: hypothetical protein VEZ48_09070 [Sphingomonadaceae bacterium]|nr:hypothetical protein [Sphingomonadaceae bacterium]
MRPPPNQTRAKALSDFRRLMRWMVALTVVLIGLALLSFRLFGIPVTGAMVIATVAGVGLSMLVGTGLMGLIFMSANSGHDDEAADHRDHYSDWVPPEDR